MHKTKGSIKIPLNHDCSIRFIIIIIIIIISCYLHIYLFPKISIVKPQQGTKLASCLFFYKDDVSTPFLPGSVLRKFSYSCLDNITVFKRGFTLNCHSKMKASSILYFVGDRNILRDVGFSHQHWGKFESLWMWQCVVKFIIPYILVESSASVFRVTQSKQSKAPQNWISTCILLNKIFLFWCYCCQLKVQMWSDATCYHCCQLKAHMWSDATFCHLLWKFQVLYKYCWFV
jgi:hypothetical protein